MSGFDQDQNDTGETSAGFPQSSGGWSSMSRLIEADTSVNAGDSLEGDFEQTVASGLGIHRDRGPNVEALADPSVLPVTVFPFLRQVNDRLAKQISLALRKRSGALVDVAVTDQVNLRLGSAVSSIPVPSLVGILQSEGQDAPVFVAIDGAMASLYFDMLLGGSQIRSVYAAPVRNFSVIETQLFFTLLESLGACANAAFAPLYPVVLKADRVETNPRFLPVFKAQDSVIKIRLLVQCGQRSGFIDLYMTTRFLAPIDAHTRPKGRVEVPVADPVWQRHLRHQLGKSKISLRARLSELTIPLYRLRNLKVGDVLPLEKGPDSLVDLVIDTKTVARGKMGRSTGRIAIRIVDTTLEANTTRDLS